MEQVRQAVGAASSAVGADTVRTLPPATVAAMSYCGVSIDDSIKLLTLLWLVLLIAGWLWDRLVKPRLDAAKEKADDAS